MRSEIEEKAIEVLNVFLNTAKEITGEAIVAYLNTQGLEIIEEERAYNIRSKRESGIVSYDIY